ncbi:hypothetical protein Tsubulata_034565 [Turnera subulata]|uniref:Protein FAR1-RELATED SEQUENCE n=1 Tax=Turnera subulata TaxID=218843 RepID=A0A9Q0F945_9ROSI|nr:hypothetical protein Tsubulata_034565 [Turnera subulata]
MFIIPSDAVTCKCMKLENVGFLCSHALKVLDNRNIKVVSSQYISRRWTKNARAGKLESSEFIGQENLIMLAARRYKDMCHSILEIAAMAAESEEAFPFALEQLAEVI